MKWIKSWTEELDSTLSQEGSIPDRLVFKELRLLAGREERGGKIKYFDVAHLGRMINIPVEILEKSLKFLKKTNRISIRQISEGYLLKIAKWKKYQGDTSGKTESQKGPKMAKTESPKIRGEKIREEKKERGKKEEITPPEFKNIAWEIQREIRSLQCEKEELESKLRKAVKNPDGIFIGRDGSMMKAEEIRSHIEATETALKKIYQTCQGKQDSQEIKVKGGERKE